MHRQEAYTELVLEDAYLPITKTVASEIVSLPLYPEPEDHEANAVVAAAREST